MPSSQAQPMRLTDWAQLSVLSILWGGSFFFSKLALAEIEPLTLVAVRMTLSALLLLAVVRMGGRSLPVTLRGWAPYLLLGAINNVIPQSLVFWGQTQISSSLASILQATTPLWTVLLAHLFTRDERLSAKRMIGVLAGMAGVTVIIGPDALGGLGLNLLAQIAVVGAAMSLAAATIFGTRFRGTPPMVIAAGQITSAALLVAPLALIVERPWTRPLPGLQTWAAVVGLVLLSTVLAYNFYFRILASAGATNIALVTFLIPVSALLLGGQLLGERLAMRHFAGMALIGVGLAAIDGRLLRRLRPARLLAKQESQP